MVTCSALTVEEFTQPSVTLAVIAAPEIAGYLVHEIIGRGGMGTVWRAERRQAEISLLYQALELDCCHAKRLKRARQGIKAEHADLTVEYLLLDSLIVRKQQQVSDTFCLGSDSLVCYWQGKKVTEPAGYVDAFTFTGVCNGERYLFSFTKPYDRQTLWEMEEGR